MKKIFSIFLVFAAFFIISCDGLLGDGSKNTVRFTLPGGNARAASVGTTSTSDGETNVGGASASGIEDVYYFNINIQDQSFTNVKPGTAIESAPITVGTSVSITVEAIGNIKEKDYVVDEGRRIAYYQTTQTMPAEGLTLSIKLSDYKISYHKVTLELNQFGGRSNEDIYVANGSSYTLPDYGIINTDTPKKHVGWSINSDSYTGEITATEKVTITGDMTFTLKAAEGVQVSFSNHTSIDLTGSTVYEYNYNYYIWKGQPLILPSGKRDDKDLTGWSYIGSGGPVTKNILDSKNNPIKYDSSWEGNACGNCEFTAVF